MNTPRWLVIILFVGAVAAFIAFDLQQ